ncbi:MAG: stalk domain-containing protein [Candidatus Cryosericum sp.]
MRRTHLLNVLVTIFLVAGLLVPSAATASSSTTVKLWIGNASMSVNGVQQPIDAQGTKPVIVAGRTLVPIRAVIEAFGGSVAWEPSARKVTVTLGKDSLGLWIGKSQASLNGIALAIDSANSAVVPVITNGRTMLPLRFVAESLGIDVQFEATSMMVTLACAVDTYPPAPPAPMLVLPADGGRFANEVLRLSWLPAVGADASRVQILASGVEACSASDLRGADYVVPAGTLTDGIYAWRVSCHNKGGWGPWSGTRSFALSSVTQPGVPTLLTPKDMAVVGVGPVTLTWAAVTGASTYHVLVVRVAQGTAQTYMAAEIPGTSYVVQAGVLAAGTSYSWQISAYAGSVAGDWTDAWAFTVGPAIPPVPGSLSVASHWNSTAPGFPSMLLSWNAVPDATSYDIWARSASGPFGPIGSVDAQHTTFTSTTLVYGGGELYVPGAVYYFKIRTVSASGTSVFTSEVSCRAAAREAPVLSSPPNSSTVTTNTVTLQWNSVQGATAYQVQWATLTDSVWRMPPDLASSGRSAEVTVASFTMSDVGGGATYYWRVRSVVPGREPYSPWSLIWSFTTPNPLVATLVASGGPVFKYFMATVVNTSKYPVPKATIMYYAVDQDGTVRRLAHFLENIPGGGAVNAYLAVPDGTASVVLIGTQIP